MLHRLRKESTLLEPTVQIGKNGITGTVVSELKRQLEGGMVKVKLLKTAGIDRHECATRLAEQTGSDIVDVRGGSIALYRRKT